MRIPVCLRTLMRNAVSGNNTYILSNSKILFKIFNFDNFYGPRPHIPLCALPHTPLGLACRTSQSRKNQFSLFVVQELAINRSDWCFLCFWSLETRVRFVCNHVHSCSIRVHSCSIRVRSCSIRVHSCALVFHSCSLVCARVHLCALVF